MATLLPMSTPGRQPFGILNDSKLRNLQSIKNRQNAITPNSAPNLKRRAASPEMSDSENVDPKILDLMGKRKRTAFDDDVSVSKHSRYSLSTVATSKPRVLPSMSTPRLDTVQKPTPTQASAPAAAGRSPTKPRPKGILGSKRRFAPPAFGNLSPTLSITAALNGTLANKKARKVRTIEESKPKSWFFDIFEESEEKQDYRMNEWTMTQSANGLDISDDEGKAGLERADRGKENIDPNEMTTPITRAMTAAAAAAAAKTVPQVSRKDEMLDEPRTPLGDLNPADYYAEGLDATSVVLVSTEPQPTEKVVTPEPAPTPIPEHEQYFTFSAPAAAAAVALSEPRLSLSTTDISAVIMASTPTWDLAAAADDVATPDTLLDTGFFAEDIEIWESESAKDENENENENENQILDAGLEADRDDVFALQEL